MSFDALSEALPNSGTWGPGGCSALPTSEPRTGGSGASSSLSGLRLLKTPTTNLASNGGSQHPDKRKAGGHGPTLADEVEWLLPTPTARSYGTNRGGAAGRTGPVRESLGTMARNGRFDDWGVYAAAIHRWEHALPRLAPEPTMSSPKTGGRPILSPALVEWMMGVDEGWVTDVPDLTRNEMLSLLGDGVVPQQGAAAYLELLGHLITTWFTVETAA